MENQKLIDLDKKVEELKNLIEKKAIMEQWVENNSDISEIINYDIEKELSWNIKLVKKMRLIYVISIFLVILTFMFLYFTKDNKKTEIIYKDKIIYQTWICDNSKNLEKDKYIKLLEEKVKKIEEKSKQLTQTQSLNPEKKELTITWTTLSKTKELSTEQRKIIEEKENKIVKKTICTWEDIISIDIHLRELPWKESNRLDILLKWETVTVLNCWEDLNWERWLKVKNNEWIEGWISFIGLKNYIPNNL